MSSLPSCKWGVFSGGLGLLLCGFVATGCELVEGDSSSGSSNCTVGAESCACYANASCDTGLTCISSVCVNADDTGSGGSDSGSGNGSNAVGGANDNSSTPASGTGGTTQTDPQSTGTGGTTTTVTTTTPAIDSPIIDAFASCDTNIESNSGRSGEWYFFADTSLNATFNVGSPGTAWADTSCGAWLLLGCTAASNCTYGGIGFQLASGNPHDLTSYSGVSVAFEGGDDVYFVVKTSNGGYFGTWLAGTSGNQTRNADFSALVAMSNSAVTSLNTSLVTEMQFTVGKSLALNGGWGLAVHNVSLY